MQFDNIDFETVSKLTCDAFHANQDDTPEFGCIISTRQSLFSYFFTKSRVEFGRRQTTGFLMCLQERPCY